MKYKNSMFRVSRVSHLVVDDGDSFFLGGGAGAGKGGFRYSEVVLL